MTAKTAKPKIQVWLGDGWPGPYLVSAEDISGQRIVSTVVFGAETTAEALEKAEIAFPEMKSITGQGTKWSIRPIYAVLEDGSVVPPRPSSNPEQ